MPLAATFDNTALGMRWYWTYRHASLAAEPTNRSHPMNVEALVKQPPFEDSPLPRTLMGVYELLPPRKNNLKRLFRGERRGERSRSPRHFLLWGVRPMVATGPKSGHGIVHSRIRVEIDMYGKVVSLERSIEPPHIPPGWKTVVLFDAADRDPDAIVGEEEEQELLKLWEELRAIDEAHRRATAHLAVFLE